ncbi:hypothetical protein FHG87_013452 [Trinorchestia longiramus]|nr:hypothetical protein FHG87_013452 [Trinorchestia longiramus]
MLRLSLAFALFCFIALALVDPGLGGGFGGKGGFGGVLDSEDSVIMVDLEDLVVVVLAVVLDMVDLEASEEASVTMDNFSTKTNQ